MNRKSVSGEFYKLLFSVVKREFNSPHYNTLHGCFEAVVRALNDVVNDRLKCADVSGINAPIQRLVT